MMIIMVISMIIMGMMMVNTDYDGDVDLLYNDNDDAVDLLDDHHDDNGDDIIVPGLLPTSDADWEG